MPPPIQIFYECDVDSHRIRSIVIVHFDNNNTKQELMNQATCIVLTHQQRSLAREERRIFDDTTRIDNKLSRKGI